jgi:transposase
MSTRTRRKYDREFKIETVRLITEGGRKVSDIARDFGIHEAVLRRWRQEYSENILHAFPGKGHLKPHEEEMRRLKRELEDIKEVLSFRYI